MILPTTYSKTQEERDANIEALERFLEDNNRPLICRSNPLTCNVYKDYILIGRAILATNTYDYYGNISLHLWKPELNMKIDTNFCTKYEPMEYCNGRLDIGCYKNPNREEGYIISLQGID